MISNKTVTGIILVAGNSTRFGQNRNKNFELINGKSILKSQIHFIMLILVWNALILTYGYKKADFCLLFLRKNILEMHIGTEIGILSIISFYQSNE